MGALLGRAPLYIPSTDAPGQLAMMTSPDAVPGQEKLIADSGHSPDEYPDTVAAPNCVAHRLLLTVGGLRACALWLTTSTSAVPSTPIER